MNRTSKSTLLPKRPPGRSAAGTAVHYIMWRFNAGGAELSVNHYAAHFGAARQLHAYGLRAVENGIYPSSAPLQVHFGALHPWRSYRRYFQYCRRHREARFHLINTGPLILLITLLAGLRRPIYHIHGTIHWKSTAKKYYLKFLWFWVSFFKVVYIANSRYSGNIFHRQVLPVDPQVIYNGFKIDQFWQHRGKRSALHRIGYAGRLNTGKNVDLVIRLFESVAAGDPAVELHLAGDGPLRAALEAQARQSPYRERIFFHGFTTDIAGFYASIDLLIFMSDYESFGNVIAEALLTGLPVLTSDLTVFQEIYRDEQAFVLGHTQERFPVLAERLQQAIDRYPELAEKAYQLGPVLKQTFSIEQHLRQIEALYE